jgi:hypothetical protein
MYTMLRCFAQITDGTALTRSFCASFGSLLKPWFETIRRQHSESPLEIPDNAAGLKQTRRTIESIFQLKWVVSRHLPRTSFQKALGYEGMAIPQQGEGRLEDESEEEEGEAACNVVRQT